MQFNRLLRQIRRSEIDLLILHKVLATEDVSLYCAFTNNSLAFAREISQLSLIATYDLHGIDLNARCIFKLHADISVKDEKSSITFNDLSNENNSTYSQIINKQIEILMLLRDVAKESPELCSVLSGMSLSNSKYITSMIPTDILPISSDKALFKLPFKTYKSLKEFIECARCPNTFQFALDMVV